MTEPADPPRGFRVHPLDLLVLVLAVALAALAYAYLFRRSPAPGHVDRFLGMTVEVEFEIDRPWKGEFAKEGAVVLIDDYLVTDVLQRGIVEPGRPQHRIATLKVRGREGQKPETMNLFRTGLHRGSRVKLTSGDSEVAGEITALQEPPPGER